jgi:hypothetical protein
MSAKTNQPTKVLTEGGDLRDAQVVIPLSDSHSSVTAYLGSITDTLNVTGGYVYAKYVESG